MSVLAEGVRELELGPSGRFLIWQGVEITNDDPEWPEGPLYLLDRESGESTQLDETALAYTPLPVLGLESLGLLRYQTRGIDGQTVEHWARLDTLEPYDDQPGFINAWWLIDDTRACFGFPSGLGSSLYLFDVSTDQLTLLYDGPKLPGSVPHEQGIYVHRFDGSALTSVTPERRERSPTT